MAQTKILGRMLVVLWLGVSVSDSRDVEDMSKKEATFNGSELLGLAGHDDPNPDIYQREVTFDLAKIWGLEDADTDNIMQREVTFHPDLKKRVSNYSGPDITQMEISHDLAVDFSPRGPAQFSPRGHAPPQIEFPLAALHLRISRQFVSMVLGDPGTPQMCCLNRALATSLVKQTPFTVQRPGTVSSVVKWEKALKLFCEDEFSVKTSHYHCCKVQGKAGQWSCFENEAPNPTYQRTTAYSGPELLPRGPAFTFTSCSRSAAPRVLRADSTDISFPPGRPTSSNIRMICNLRKLRPRYTPSCLPGDGYGWLVRQSKAINRFERGLKRCCKGKKKVLACADEKWKEEMNRFCQDEHVVKTNHYVCCKVPKGEERFSCFSSNAPHPAYQAELLQQESISVFPHLRLVCDTHKILQKLQTGLPVDSVVKKCCHLVPDQRHACLQDTLDNLQKESCSAESPSPMVTPDCCAPNPSKCFSNLLLTSIEKAVKTPSFKRRKCPLTIQS